MKVVIRGSFEPFVWTWTFGSVVTRGPVIDEAEFVGHVRKGGMKEERREPEER
jgi:hypothetical protein